MVDIHEINLGSNAVPMPMGLGMPKGVGVNCPSQERRRGKWRAVADPGGRMLISACPAEVERQERSISVSPAWWKRMKSMC